MNTLSNRRILTNHNRDSASKSYLRSRLWLHRRRRVHHLDWWTAALYFVALGYLIRYL